MKIMAFTVIGMAILAITAFARSVSAGETPKILIVFFSRTNNTKSIAEHVQARVGGDLFQVATRKPYPQDYRQTTQVARVEQDNNERPELAAAISPEEMKSYDVIFLGYPIWWGTMPMAMFTFLEQYGLSGKTIIPFCTHGGSGLGRSPDDIGKLAPGATLRQGLAIRGDSAGQAKNDVDNWLRQLGYVR